MLGDETLSLLIGSIYIGSLLVLVVFYLIHRLHTTALKYENAVKLIENLEEGVYRSSLDGKQLSANPALVKLNGYDTESELLEAVEDIALEWYVDPRRRDEFAELLRRDGVVKNFVSEIYRHKTRERIWITENARLVRHPRTNKPEFYEGTVRDITDTVARRQMDDLIKNLTDKLPTGLFQLVRHPDGTFTCPYVSERFREMENLGENEEFKAEAFARRVHHDDLDASLMSLKTSRKSLCDWNHEFRIYNRNGLPVWCNIQATPERWEDGSIVWHGHLSNVSDRKFAEEQVYKLAYFDPLTGLSNRTHFLEQTADFLEGAGNSNTISGISFIDLDNFKQLNDTHGHGYGDKLLNAVAKRLTQNISGEYLLSRFGGDEFVILFKNLGSNHAEAQKVADRLSQSLLKEIRKGFVIDEVDCPMTMSMGIALFERSPRIKVGELLKSADIAMYEAKKSGRNNVVFHDVSTQKNVTETYNLQRDVQIAIKDNQFELELQPKINSAGRIECAETLIRWNHPERGRIMPNEFIKLAEQTGQIGHLNDWVLKESVGILSSWRHDEALENLVLSVNISARQMLDRQFIEQITIQLEEQNIPPRCLMIELTEHVMARNPELVEENMSKLKAIGVQFSLDDFGTGYSSISQLRQFPFDELKIDGSFVSDITEQSEVQSLVSAILSMAKALGLRTVAEHVTTQDQLELLMSLGCNLFQGYLFARAMPLRDFETFVHANHPKQNKLLAKLV